MTYHYQNSAEAVVVDGRVTTACGVRVPGKHVYISPEYYLSPTWASVKHCPRCIEVARAHAVIRASNGVQ